MSLSAVTCGHKAPKEINVVIEIPLHSAPVKYEANKDAGVLFVDRFLSTPMFYPANYGYIPHTLSEDTDPVDVLVITPMPLQHGIVINCRPVGMLKMADESGIDAKIIAVPVNRITKIYQAINNVSDLPDYLLKQIEHFFKHYKDLESEKWVRIEGWEEAEAAKQEIISSIDRFCALVATN